MYKKIFIFLHQMILNLFMRVLLIQIARIGCIHYLPKKNTRVTYGYCACQLTTLVSVSVSLGAILTPKRNWRKCLCKILGVTNKEHYGMFCYFLEWSISSIPSNFSKTQVLMLAGLTNWLPRGKWNPCPLYFLWPRYRANCNFGYRTLSNISSLL